MGRRSPLEEVEIDTGGPNDRVCPSTLWFTPDMTNIKGHNFQLVREISNIKERLINWGRGEGKELGKDRDHAG